MTIAPKRCARCLILLVASMVGMTGCERKPALHAGFSGGVAVETAGMLPLHERVAAAVGAAPEREMRGGGLAGVMGGVRVKLLQKGRHEVLLPIPQWTPEQVPLCFALVANPPGALVESRLVQKDDQNVVLLVHLDGARDQEVRLGWSAVVLLGERPASPDPDSPEPYRRATSCVQAGDRVVQALVRTLWPADGRVDRFAAAIQAHIRGMRQKKPPRSMDAEGILASGANWICTGNANLAGALLRAKGIPARTLAVVPTIGRRLEMHRIVECYDDGRWHRFDPSSLHADIPMEPWQSIVMARTTIADEEAAMKPRVGASPGAPYGQELELLTPTVTLWGDDFFWTLAKPLARFDAGEEAWGLARAAWERFLATGTLAQEPIAAARASDAAGFLDALRGRE